MTERLPQKYQEVAIPIIHDAFQSIQGKWVEQDFMGDSLGDRFSELDRRKGMFEQPDVTLESSKLMTYDE